MHIEKNVPAPEETRGRPAKYPFAEMQIGDSILVDGESVSTKECPAYGAATQHGRHHGKRFSGRKQGNGKVRIWRVE